MLDANRFTGLGFMASYWNADPSVISPMGVADKLALQITWGMTPAERTDDEELSAWIRRAGSWGIRTIPWGWCNAHDTATAEVEGEYHAERCIDLGFTEEWIANMEAPYDAGGNSDSPKYTMAVHYANAFVSKARELGVTFRALGVTTTPFFASSQWELANAGWVTMPQAFCGDYPEATLAACVAHMQGWGWPPALIRPLVQVYEPRPPVDPYLTESKAAGVGAVPYIVEQAMDTGGRAMLGALVPATFRPPSDSPQPPPDGGDVELIGKQHGIKAAYNRMRALDPEGCNPAFDPDNYNAIPLDQLKAWDKECRTKLILAADHDEVASSEL